MTPPPGSAGRSRIPRRWLAVVLVVAGCGTSTLTTTPAPTETQPALASSQPTPAPSADPCLGPVTHVAAFAAQLSNHLAALRPMITTKPFESAETASSILAVSGTLTAFDGLEDRLRECPETAGFRETVSGLRATARELIGRSVAASVNDATVQRETALALFALLPNAQALAVATLRVADAHKITGQVAVVPESSAQPIGSLPPLPTDVLEPTPNPLPIDGSSPAHQFVDNNPQFAGYGTRPRSITSASMRWVEPTISCTLRTGSGVAVWVGIQDDDGQLQQAGTYDLCDAKNHLEHRVFWEDYPLPAKVFALAAVPGHRMYARVSVKNGLWTYVVKDETTGKSTSTSRQVTMDPTTAEWLVERAVCPHDFSTICPLPKFTPVKITSASVTAAGGTAWVGQSDQWIWRSVMSKADRTLAATSGLSSNGAGFTITFRRSS